MGGGQTNSKYKERGWLAHFKQVFFFSQNTAHFCCQAFIYFFQTEVKVRECWLQNVNGCGNFK